MEARREMTRVGHLMEHVLAPDNMRRAVLRAARGKHGRASVSGFLENFESRTDQLRDELQSGTFQFGRFTYFEIHDPKRRRIAAARFEERVVHHALMAVCGPVLEGALISHTYACRVGMGRTGALRQAVRCARRADRVLKLDIRAYFDSVDHRVLFGMLERRIKDARVLQVFWDILASYSTGDQRGLPIGSLTSQCLANLYLNPLDRWVMADRRCRGYVRYMDDFLVFGNERVGLLEMKREVESMLATQLRLRLKEASRECSLARGVDFLGYRVRHAPDVAEGRRRVWVTLARRSKRRFVTRLGDLYARLSDGAVTELDFQRRSLALCEFTRCARALDWRRGVLVKLETDADGRATRAPRRQLEQPSSELPLREPQREPAGQPQRQRRIPACPRPSSTDP